MQSAAKTALRFRRRNPSAAHPARRRLQLESLEDRSLLSGLTMAIGDATATEGDNTIKFIDRFVAEGSGGLARPRASIFGPDGDGDGVQDLYVPSVDTNQILRYDGETGAFLDVFVAAGSGGLNGPGDIKFGPDGDLYVTSFNDGQLLRYDAAGNYMDALASGLSNPLGLTFGADGGLYIANQGANDVLRYDSSGLSVFVAPESGGLSLPRNSAFGPDGNLYVASNNSGQVLRFSGQTGAFIDAFATTAGMGPGPNWLAFGPDGYLYATARTTTGSLNTSIVRFDAASGALHDSYALGRDGWSFNFGPDGLVYDSSNAAGNFVERFGPSSLAAFTVSLSSASASAVTVAYSTTNGTAAAGSDYVAVSGTVTFAPGQMTQTILVNTLDDAIQEPTETFTVNLSNPVGAAIARSQGVGTISDNDPLTKFYVVNDGSPDRTYEYAGSGAAVENYAINTANTAPRGAASTAAGDKVWVVDANKNVYVYNTSGGLLGSWSAGSLPNKTNLQGITVSGSDVWIVDAQSDKIYKYGGAATRLSGSQTAASSFSLNSSNSAPTDLVTDGSSIWVTNNSRTDQVFKYTVSGTLLGKWTIDPADSSPTGITIDPTNVSNIWIVDNVALKIFQYNAAASRASGSQTAAATYALSSGNTNPQGIADPPASSVSSTSAAATDAALMLLLADDPLIVTKRK